MGASGASRAGSGGSDRGRNSALGRTGPSAEAGRNSPPHGATSDCSADKARPGFDTSIRQKLRGVSASAILLPLRCHLLIATVEAFVVVVSATP
jgi:hypothetical protein